MLITLLFPPVVQNNPGCKCTGAVCVAEKPQNSKHAHASISESQHVDDAPFRNQLTRTTNFPEKIPMKIVGMLFEYPAVKCRKDFFLYSSCP